MQARYYDPVIGRFYSNDPVGVLGHISTGSIQGFNRYNYAYNNPYKYTDPDGEHPSLIRAGKEGYRLGTYINMGLSLVIQATTGSDSLGELIYDIVNSEEATDDVSDRSDGDGNSDEVDGLVEELDGMSEPQSDNNGIRTLKPGVKVDDILGKTPGQELPNGRKKTEEGGNIGTHESSSTTNSDGTRAKTITISRPKTGRVNSGTRKYREHDE